MLAASAVKNPANSSTRDEPPGTLACERGGHGDAELCLHRRDARHRPRHACRPEPGGKRRTVRRKARFYPDRRQHELREQRVQTMRRSGCI